MSGYTAGGLSSSAQNHRDNQTENKFIMSLQFKYKIKALCYKPKVTGSKPDEVNYFGINLPNTSGCIRLWGLPSL
jgi:hypothetical protein